MRRTEVEVQKITDATKEEEKAFILAAKEFENQINDPDFWYEVSIHYNSWLYKNGMSFAEFRELVLSGQDKFEDRKDYNIRIWVDFYYSWKRVVGYTYPSTIWTWVNRNVFKGFDVADIAGNQFHEYLHNLGLDHPGADRRSLVYLAGYLMRDRIKKTRGIEVINSVPRRSFWTRVRSFFKRLF
jgi:hypothetical protein